MPAFVPGPRIAAIPPQEPVLPPETGQLPGAGEISGTLREVLSGPDFTTFEAPAGNPFVERLMGYVGDFFEWITQLFERDATGLLPALAVIIPVLALVAAGVLVIRHRRGRARDPAAADGAPAETVPVTANEWLSLAGERAAKGHFRPAATALYQGFLLTLDRGGGLAYHPSKTPGDYAMEMARGRSAGAEAGAGGRFLNAFQGFSFGQERPTEGGYAALAGLAREAGCPADAADPEPESS